MGKRLVSIIAVTACLVSLISGCTIYLVPSKIPPLDIKTEGLPGPFDNIAVSLVNAQPDDSNFSVRDQKGNDTGWVLSRKLWTDKLAEALSAELKARQAKVAAGAPVTVSLKVTDVIYTGRPPGNIEYKVTASVTTNTGWTKTYTGSGDAVMWVPAGTTEDKNWNRAANWTIRDVVRAIMSDPEFIAALNKKK